MAKNKGGRPPTHDEPNEMQKLVDAYFLKCKGDEENKILPEHPTITGLALALGFNSRQSLLNYAGKPEFVDTIKGAKLRVEQYLEQRLFESNATGCIFNLKNNFDWKDKTETELSGSVGVRKEQMTDDELADIAKGKK